MTTDNGEEPRDPQANEDSQEQQQDPQQHDPLQSGAGPDSTDVDGEAEAKNAEESGGYGY
ncbi:hypothetical protein E4J89_02625 [Arthrobacter sp. CAU 1506]|uniref:hypothetical protein n=1 Tax=Arthrobacter sp. CAU 1506 TaxID=2560052 RepID=UPI0010AB52FD|nr:hypothetical protein [Arthrobacter sp. CAU 1506]TJY72581.1 hypothetical protein E4J89_02625 [Arthrobacter sp. CAU 1506]